ncbi:MAG: WD40 repeat domain-containing protein [Candidatus Azambacteria bacterium]|nr:WD40 repeat domain-containing protein [Candidatus Azambacteria bacterium]
MTKKTFYIILMVLAGLLIIGGLVWYFFFRPTASPAPQGAGFTLPGQETAAGGMTPISEGPIIAAHFSGEDILFYDISGKIWQFGNGYQKPIMIDQAAVENPAEIIWSVSEKNIVKTGLNQSDIRYVFSDFGKKILVNLKTGIKSVVFSPDAKKIIYQIADFKNNGLFISDPDGKNQKTLIGEFKLRDIILKWPKTGQIAIISKPSGLAPGGLWVLDAGTLKFARIIDNTFGLEALFSPSGANFIYSSVDQNGRNPRIAVYKNGASKDIANISTLVDKCAWAGDSINIYCAVPTSWPGSSTLPDDYYKNAFATMDNFWKINTETGEKNLIFQDMGDISNIELSPDGGRLIFISRDSRFLYQLNLK